MTADISGTEPALARPRLLLATTVLAAGLCAFLIARHLSGPMLWPLAPVGFDRDPSEYLPGYLWPAAMLSLFVLAVLPGLLPRSIAKSISIQAVSRAALLIGLVVSLVLVIGVVTTPIL